MIEIEPDVCITSKHDEDDSIEDQSTTETEPYTESREQYTEKETNSCLLIFKLKWKTEKLNCS